MIYPILVITLLLVTTLHKDVTERLEKINPQLASEARKVLDVNKSERHIRGGLATKEKYMNIGSISTNNERNIF